MSFNVARAIEHPPIRTDYHPTELGKLIIETLRVMDHQNLLRLQQDWYKSKTPHAPESRNEMLSMIAHELARREVETW